MFILGIIIHELGHLLGGLISGYHFLFIEIFGLSLEKINGKFYLKYHKGMPVGQCLMYPKDINKNGIFLIMGGVMMNLSISIICLMILVYASTFCIKLLLIVISTVNMSLVLMNIFGSSTSDGRTALEVIRSSEDMRIYNTLLVIEKYFREGKSYSDMPRELFMFSHKNHGLSGLKSEMNDHIKKYEAEKRRLIEK